MRKNKYNNTKCTYDGFSFDSVKEKDRYIYLCQAQSKGLITNITVHPTFELIPKISEEYVVHLKTKDKIKKMVVQQPITYTADFSYYKGDKYVVEDVKISPKLLPVEFKLKVKLLRFFHNISVKLIYKPTTEI